MTIPRVPRFDAVNTSEASVAWHGIWATVYCHICPSSKKIPRSMIGWTSDTGRCWDEDSRQEINRGVGGDVCFIPSLSICIQMIGLKAPGAQILGGKCQSIPKCQSHPATVRSSCICFWFSFSFFFLTFANYLQRVRTRPGPALAEVRN